MAKFVLPGGSGFLTRWAPPAPTPMVWLGAHLVMRADPGLALTGRNCIPQKFLDEGFRFQHTDLEATLRGLTS